jgi:hypothetical protein
MYAPYIQRAAPRHVRACRGTVSAFCPGGLTGPYVKCLGQDRRGAVTHPDDSLYSPLAGSACPPQTDCKAQFGLKQRQPFFKLLCWSQYCLYAQHFGTMLHSVALAFSSQLNTALGNRSGRQERICLISIARYSLDPGCSQ